MTAPRVRCAAAGLFHDKHQAVDRWWILTSPDGQEAALCSATCILEWICYREWPAESARSRLPAGEPQPLSRERWAELRAIADRRAS